MTRSQGALISEEFAFSNIVFEDFHAVEIIRVFLPHKAKLCRHRCMAGDGYQVVACLGNFPECKAYGDVLRNHSNHGGKLYRIS